MAVIPAAKVAEEAIVANAGSDAARVGAEAAEHSDSLPKAIVDDTVDQTLMGARDKAIETGVKLIPGKEGEKPGEPVPGHDGSTTTDYLDVQSRKAKAPWLLGDKNAPADGAAPVGAKPEVAAPAAGLLKPADPDPRQDVSLGTKVMDGVSSFGHSIAVGANPVGNREIYNDIYDLLGGTRAPDKNLVTQILQSNLVSELGGGAIDAADNLFKFADDVVAKAEKAGMPNIYFQVINRKGEWDPQAISPEQFRAGQKAGTQGLFEIPSSDKPEAAAGDVIRNSVTFVIGRGGAVPENVASKAGFIAEAVRDFRSGVVAMDPQSDRLSNVIDEKWPNLVTSWLKAKPEEEGTILGHIKSGLENAGVGLAFAGLATMLKRLKNSVTQNLDLPDVNQPSEPHDPGGGGPGGGDDEGITPQNAGGGRVEPSYETKLPPDMNAPEVRVEPNANPDQPGSSFDFAPGEEPAFSGEPPNEPPGGGGKTEPALGEPPNEALMPTGTPVMPPRVLESSTKPDEALKPHPGTGYLFVSPNIEEGTTVEDARKALTSDEQARAQAVAKDINTSIGLETKDLARGYGMWKDGAENTMVTETKGVEFDQLRLSAALQGREFNQKMTIAWLDDPKGEHTLYSWQLPDGAKVAEIDKELTAAGLEYHTLVPSKDGLQVMILDTDGSLGATVEKYVKGLDQNVQETANAAKGTGEFLGDFNTRIAATRQYNRVIDEVGPKYGYQETVSVEGRQRPASGGQGLGDRDTARGAGGSDQEGLPGAGQETGGAGKSPQGQSLADLKNDLPWEPGSPGPGKAPQFLQLGDPNKPPIEFGDEFAGETPPPPPTIPQNNAAGEAILAQEAGTTHAPLNVADYMEGGANPIRVNLGRIGSADDVKDMVARVATFIEPKTVMSHDEMVWAADGTGFTPEDLLQRYAGGSGIDQRIAEARSQLLAARMIRDSGASQLLDYAKAAVAPGATPESKALALKAVSMQLAIQQEVAKASTEAGRMLNSLKIMSQSNDRMGERIARIIEDSGGQQSVDELLGSIAVLEPRQIPGAVTSMTKMSPSDWMMFARYNAILSPGTIVKKLTSDGLMDMWDMSTRWVAAQFGSSGAITNGEVAQLAYGYFSSQGDGLRAATRAMSAGHSLFQSEYQTMDSMHYSRLGQLADGNAPPEGPTAAAVKYLRMMLPTTHIGAADDYATTVQYLAQLRSLAYRQAIATPEGTAESAKAFADEMVKRGRAERSLFEQIRTAPDSIDTQMAQTMELVPDDLRQQAIDMALKNTFKEPLNDIATKIKDVADAIVLPTGVNGWDIPLGRMIVPFVRIPANIMKWTYRNGPLPLLMPSDAFKAELAAGGARRDLALAQVGLGTTVAVTGLGLYLAGKLTGGGPTNPELRKAWSAAGNEPYTLQLGDGKVFKYSPAEPMGTTLSIIADTGDIMRFAKDEDRAQLAESLMFGIGKTMMSRSYLMGWGQFNDAMNAPDDKAGAYARDFAASMIPMGGMANAARKGFDEFQRQHYDLMSNIENKLPIVSESLPPARTRWGDPVKLSDAYLPFLGGTGVARAISPFNIGRDMAVQPIDKWIWENRMAFPRGDDNKLGLPSPGGPTQIFSTAGGKVLATVELTPGQLDRYKVLAGNGMKDPSTGMGAKDTLNALVEGNYPKPGMQTQWNTYGPQGQAFMVQAVVQKFNAAAKMQMLTEYPNLNDAVTSQWTNKAAKIQQQQPQQQAPQQQLMQQPGVTQ